MLPAVALTLSTLALTAAAGLAVRLLRDTGWRTVWAPIVVALTLVAGRQLHAWWALVVDPSAAETLTPGPEILTLAASALLLGGLVHLAPRIPNLGRALAVQSSFERALESSRYEVYIFDPDTLAFLHVTRTARENLGCGRDELLGRTVPALLTEPSEDVLRQRLGPLLDGTRERVELEGRHTRLDGSSYPVEVDVQLANYRNRPCCVAVATDVTERTRVETALRESEAHFRSVIENANDLVTVVDRSGEIVYQSPAARSIVGVEADDRVGRSGLELIHPDDLEGTLIALNRIFSSDSHDLTSLVYRLRHSDGSYRTIEAVGSVRHLEGRGPELVLNQRDITERVEARKQRAAVEAQLREAQKMETIGTLAGGIAHDINNLLAPILGHAELLRDHLSDDDQAIDGLDEILSAAMSARAVVQQILAYSRRVEPVQNPIDMVDIVKGTLALVRSTAPSRIEIRERYSSTPCTVLADATQLQQVLLNLCTNAVHALSDSGGTLSVELAPAAVDHDLARTHPDLHEGRYVRLRVSDDGGGIPGDVLDRIFEPFFTTKSVGEGTGLGLAVARGILTDHGGDITVDTRLGEGTTFTVWLPAVEAPLQDADPDPADRATPSRRGHVLVVDDDDSVRRIVAMMLERSGYRVTSAASVCEALERFDALDVAPDIVLTDHAMPDRTGIDLAAALSSRKANLPIALMTGNAESIRQEELAAVGIQRILAKPFRVDDVLAVLDGLERTNAAVAG